jgi:predicted TIM-barrel fold metal-dependent hydrolase
MRSHDEHKAAQPTAAPDGVGSDNWASAGAESASQRCATLDILGINRQLVFPPVTWPALHATERSVAALLRRYNDYVLQWAAGVEDRVRPVAQLPMRDAAETIAEASRVVDAGAQAVEIPISNPPAGLSPADVRWDPLWHLLAEARVPVVLHVGAGGIGTMGGQARSFLDLRWGATDSLRQPLEAGAVHPYGDVPGNTGAFDIATQHVAAETFLTALVLGGTLARVPNLRVGVLEFGAQWVSSWVERLDMAWEGAAGLFRYRGAAVPRRPSMYVREQVRVAAVYGEPVGRYIERDGLSEVYVFSSDYPHVEGGVDPVDRFLDSLAPYGRDVTDAFFRTNSLALLPA